MSILLGYDVGSSSVKATLLDAEKDRVLAAAASPSGGEMEIAAPSLGWAEQDPELWWKHLRRATKMAMIKANFDGDLGGIGISYQMHGLVIVDVRMNVLRPPIIWCDSRAVQIGEKAAKEIGPTWCFERLLNLPGNFTASKLRWVLENEPGVFHKIHKMMLPGDYIAMRMTGQIRTTPSGLSEGIMWDFEDNHLAEFVLKYYGIPTWMVAPTVPTFSVQGELTAEAARELGLRKGTRVTYRAGDQPNNALSLNVLNPGEIAVTAGTSGVVYGVSGQKRHDPLSRVNVFLHVNHSREAPRYGVLLCLNGTGILNSWLRRNFPGLTYEKMNELAAQVPIGSDGLVVLPYGNGAERTLENRNIGASFHGLNFNVHDRRHILRASQEGIVFALNYGLGIMRGMGVKVKTVRAGNANMFLSPLFREAFATVTGATVELYNTDGSQGAARGAGIGAGIYKSMGEAFAGLKPVATIEPDKNGKRNQAYQDAYGRWLEVLRRQPTV